MHQAHYNYSPIRREHILTKQKFAILWDMDGTIVDTQEAHFKTWCDALQKFGFSLSKEVFDAAFGRNNRTTLPIFLGFEPDEAMRSEIIRVKEERFREIVRDESSLVPGVKRWLKHAKTNHIPQAIASSAPMANITAILEGFDLLDFFEIVVSGEHLPAKPRPDIFLNTADRINQNPDCCLVIEDSLAGVNAAKAAGMLCIAVSRGRAKSDFDLADIIIEDFTRAPELIFEKLGLG